MPNGGAQKGSARGRFAHGVNTPSKGRILAGRLASAEETDPSFRTQERGGIWLAVEHRRRGPPSVIRSRRDLHEVPLTVQGLVGQA